MQSRTYYLTTIESWQRESPRFTTSHYIHADPNSPFAASTKILAMVEADEGTHNSLAINPGWQEFPHALSSNPIPQSAAEVLEPHGVCAFATTFEATEVVAKNHPILRYRPL
ncbi:MAG: hypothetical protein WB995_11310 [Candidatus Acidiferrales bacterium]